MFRRRAIRRPPLFRRPLSPQPGAPLPLGMRQILAHANNLMATGQFAEAAAIFERLAEEATQHNMPIRAADLSLQAARAYFAADDVDAALERGGEALRLFTRGGRAWRVPRALVRMTAALREKGYNIQAEQLEREAAQALEEIGLSLDEVQRSVPQATEQHGNLPARCSGCGASLLPDEVEWHAAHTAECPYCGAVVKAA